MVQNMKFLKAKAAEKLIGSTNIAERLKPKVPDDIRVQVLKISWLVAETVRSPGMVVPLFQELNNTRKAVLGVFRSGN